MLRPLHVTQGWSLEKKQSDKTETTRKNLIKQTTYTEKKTGNIVIEIHFGEFH